MESRFRKVKLTQSAVDRADPEATRYVLADTIVSGFWMRVEPSGAKSDRLRYRVGGGRKATVREPKIGDAKAMKLAKARAIAEEWHAEVVRGGNPSGERMVKRDAPTMTHLFGRFMSDYALKRKKPHGIAADGRCIRIHLMPCFGKMKVGEVTDEDVDRFHARLSDAPSAANRSLAVLSKALSLAEKWKLRPRASNPCRDVKKYPESVRKRFLSPAELARLGEALRIAERDGYLILPARDGVRTEEEPAPVNRWAVAAIRLLVLTGARKSEILSLRWDWVDAASGRANLPDLKTGEKTIILTIGIARATATVMLANMAYNMKRWCWLDGRSLPA